ncbi:RNA-binding protein 20 isoform X2 [Denticeps clupeoides]|uniref:RNA-binding protein 20 isoform X2 n=1 Tax=Denticeps clupeoides TaxID=299321 RepID=UPI0010A53A25|nr:RNA-binding protein 20 isoform X2 [Denticeps clupeoides]
MDFWVAHRCHSLKKEPWKHPASFSQTGKPSVVPGSAGRSGARISWPSSSQQFHPRAELYNPEEPTGDTRFSPAGGLGAGGNGVPGLTTYQQLPAGPPDPTPLTQLQPHQRNDFHGVTPSLLPHQCTICDKKVYNLKDWEQHVKGKLHLQNCSLCTESSATPAVNFPVSFEGCLNGALGNKMAYSSAPSQDVSSGPGAPYIPVAGMKAFPPSAAYTFQSESKFLPRKACPGRVVHICNLPEGSCTENDVINLGLPFGKVTNYILMRSTHQAFLEMAYVEAAQAMVQYYQLKPATINDQKVLIRMSKRYQELQLKKPGKNVESIIQDINSQRERDEMQEINRYPPDRARSRSPVRGSLSPCSHSPTFTSCSSAHSPQGPPCRSEWSNGLGPRRPSWDWTPHVRREEEQDRSEGPWRNGDEDRPNNRPLPDRRRSYLKPGERMSPRTMEDRGRDWYSRSSPQDSGFLSYRSMDDGYKKELPYKSEKLPRMPYSRYEMKVKKRDAIDFHRSRYSESDLHEDSVTSRTAEDRNQGSTERTRDKKFTRRQQTKERDENEQNKETCGDESLKENSVSPNRPSKNIEPPHQDKESDAEDWDSGEDTEGEFWYPKNMEELVTVDEVGGEDDSIVEPDLPDLQETALSNDTVTSCQTGNTYSAGMKTVTGQTEEAQGNKMQKDPSPHESRDEGTTDTTSMLEVQSSTEQPTSALSHFSTKELKTAVEETCSVSDVTVTEAKPAPDCLPNHASAKSAETHRENDSIAIAALHTESEARKEPDTELRKKDLPNSLHQTPHQIEMDAPVSQKQVIGEHSIPLGVEFIVPRTGFYCTLCSLFYTSENTAKTSHCRSTVHYRNLQKYLSQLAEESLLLSHTESMASE